MVRELGPGRGQVTWRSGNLVVRELGSQGVKKRKLR
jgi:hypothetical protein